MNNITKGKSPFYPGQPVPKELFIGRTNEIERISRAIKQVELGKPQAVFLTGEYGIGKSSLAGFMRFLAERDNNILGIHVFLGGAEKIEDIAVRTVEAVIKSPAYKLDTTDKIQNLLSKYISKLELFGLSVDFDALQKDSINISQGFLPFLKNLLQKFKDDGIKGIMLILDEINGITKNEKFAHFIKGLVDENALSNKPLPLMLMLCGVEERRREMIQLHQPVERIFDIVDIKPMNESEMKTFFSNAFSSEKIEISKEAMEVLCYYSAGFPRIMHIIGDNTFWMDKDNVVDREDAVSGVIETLDEIGRKFIEQQVFKALRSEDYRSILAKLSMKKFDLSFQKSIIEDELSSNEKKKFNNFLQRMKKLKVLRSGDIKGEYVFNSRLVRLYIRLNSPNLGKRKN